MNGLQVLMEQIGLIDIKEKSCLQLQTAFQNQYIKLVY